MFLLGVILYISIASFLIRKFDFLEQNYLNSKSKLSSIISNEVNNIDVIKSYNLEDCSLQRVMKANQRRKKHSIKLRYFNYKNRTLHKNIELFIYFGIF